MLLVHLSVTLDLVNYGKVCVGNSTEKERSCRDGL